MEAENFLNNYDFFLDEIGVIIKPELLPLLTELRTTVQWDTVNIDREHKDPGGARGLVWSIFISKALSNFDFRQD